MLQFVWNWRKHLEHDVSVYFQGVPQAEVIETVSEKLNNKQVDMNVNHPAKANQFPIIEKGQDTEKSLHEVKEHNFFYNPKLNVKMHQVRALAKKLGIEFTASTKKEELIRLINEKR